MKLRDLFNKELRLERNCDLNGNEKKKNNEKLIT